MKFKVGNQVEVLRRTEESFASWFPAKIISVDGYMCTVRFELFLTIEGEPVVEKVYKEDIRPCPPPVRDERWVRGDITEVFDVHSWRMGKVAKVLPNSRFVIRLFGSIQLKEFHYSSLRVRQAWNNYHWVIIEKAGRNKPIDHNRTHSSSQNSQNLHCESQGGINEEACTKQVYGQSTFDTFSSTRTLKRNLDSHFYSSSDVAFMGSGKKRKATLEVGGCPLASRTLSKQVIEDNNECSVASCSSNNFAEYKVRNSQESYRGIACSSFDDESSYPSEPGKKYMHCAKDELAANVHKLELHAYQSTMQALYALGPLSWEQETLLTNLRLSLHISNEEHLIQLRHLLSPQVL